MQNIINTILQCYFLEGVKANAVAMTLVDGLVTCMAPVQHNAARAKAIRNRIRRNLPQAFVEVQFTTLIHNGAQETQHAIQVKVAE